MREKKREAGGFFSDDHPGYGSREILSEQSDTGEADSPSK